LVSSFEGLPLYVISPEPATRAFKLFSAYSLISPEPAKLTTAFLAFNL